MGSSDPRPLPGAPADRPPAVVGVLVALLIALLGLAWVADERTVTLSIDGDAALTRTHAATVGELLERAGVEVGPEDAVSPAPDTSLADGMTVAYVRARQITLLVGDVEQQILVTSLSVEDVLAELGVAAPRRSLVRPSRATPVRSGMTVEITESREPVALVVIADGSRREVITDSEDVGELLDRLGIDVGPRDRVIPGPGHPTEAGIVVTVQRVTTAVETRRVAIPHGTVERQQPDLPRGERRVVAAGEDGVREVTEEVVLVDGAEESRTVVEDRVVAAARDEVVEVGSGAPAPPAAPDPAPAPDPDPDPASDPAPAESAPSPEPAADRNVQEGGASWYDSPGGGMTAAHRTIPRGTSVTVTNLENGRSVEVRIDDRGPFVEGRIIDLDREAFAAIASVSEGVARVRIEW